MSRSPAAPRPLAPLIQTAWYPDDLVSELQSTLAALADLEVQYEMDRERLETSAGLEGIKKKFAAQLEEHHQQEREGYVQRLTNLHCWIIKIMAREDIGSSP